MFDAYHWNVLAWSALFAFIAAVIACIIVIVKYKRKLKSPIYPVEKYANLSLNACQDAFIGSIVTRVKVSSPSDKR